MKHKIIINNVQRISDFLGIELSRYPNFLEAEKELKKEFLKRYDCLLDFADPDKIEQFYEKTGLIVGHEFEKNDYSQVYFDAKAIYQLNADFLNLSERPNIKNIHLIVKTEVDDIYEKDGKIFALDEKEEIVLCDLKQAFKYRKKNDLIDKKVRDHGYFNLYTIPRKIECIKENMIEDYFNLIDTNQIIQIELTELNNFMILLKDGTLYVDRKLYSKNVKEIFYWSYNLYIMYQDNTVDRFIYINYFPSEKYDKIIRGSFFLAGLKDKCCLISILDVTEKERFFELYGIDDMTYQEGDDFITLMVGENQIEVSLETPRIGMI